VETVNGDDGPDVVLTQDNVGDGTTYKQYSATDKTKLAGVASGATANSSDATLLARANHTGTQAISTVVNLQTELDGKQPVDGALTAISGLTPANDDIIQRKAGAWVSRTPTQYKADLGLVKGDVGLGNVDNTSDATKNAAVATLTNKTLTAPVINSPTGIVKGDVGLGNVDNTSNATERAATATLTNKTLTAPVINSPTGIVKADVGLGNVDNTSNATERAATATLTNKTIALGSNTVSGTTAQFNSANTDGDFATLAGTETLTNKRITKRVSTTADTATLTIASDDYDCAKVTALAQAMTIAAPTGTPTAMQGLIIRIKDNGTARALTWNAAFRAIGVTLPTTTVISKTVYVGCIWNSDDSKWDVIAVSQES